MLLHPHIASVLRDRRHETAPDGHHDGDEHLVLDTNFDTDDEIEYGMVDKFSIQGRSFFGGVGLAQFRAAQFALVRQGCVGLENAYVCDADGGSPDPNEYVNYRGCGEPFFPCSNYDKFARLLRESVCAEFVYRMHPSTEHFDGLACSRLQDFGEGVFEMLVHLAHDTRHGHMPITSVLMLHAIELYLLSLGAAAAELPFAVRARPPLDHHLRADVIGSDDDASMRSSDLDSRSSHGSDGMSELEWTSGDEEEWQDEERGLQSYPGEYGCSDMFEHVPMWNSSPYRSSFLSARATALGIDDLDLSLHVPASLLRAWPVLRLGDPGAGPTFETYASFTNRAVNIFAKAALRWVGFYVVAESKRLRRRHAIRAVERKLDLPTPLFAFVEEFAADPTPSEG